MAGTLITSTIQGTTLTDGTNSTSTTNCIQGSAKAWVNFAGAATPTINNSFNVSSITYNTTGDYTVNFTTAMPNANYVMCGSSQTVAGVGSLFIGAYQTSPYTTTSARINAWSSFSGAGASPSVQVAFFSS
jgi:hypothetical protein